MKQSVISLKPEVAQAYMEATEDDRKKVNEMINRWLKNILFRRKDPRERLIETMDDIGTEAKQNGLNSDILDQILGEIENEKG